VPENFFTPAFAARQVFLRRRPSPGGVADWSGLFEGGFRSSPQLRAPPRCWTLGQLARVGRPVGPEQSPRTFPKAGFDAPVAASRHGTQPGNRGSANARAVDHPPCRGPIVSSASARALGWPPASVTKRLLVRRQRHCGSGSASMIERCRVPLDLRHRSERQQKSRGRWSVVLAKFAIQGSPTMASGVQHWVIPYVRTRLPIGSLNLRWFPTVAGPGSGSPRGFWPARSPRKIDNASVGQRRGEPFTSFMVPR